MKQIKIIITIIATCFLLLFLTVNVKANVPDYMPQELFNSAEECLEWYYNNRDYHFWYRGFFYTDCKINNVVYPYYPFKNWETKKEYLNLCYKELQEGRLKWEFMGENNRSWWYRNGDYYKNAPSDEIKRINEEREKALEKGWNFYPPICTTNGDTITIEPLDNKELEKADYSM